MGQRGHTVYLPKGTDSERYHQGEIKTSLFVCVFFFFTSPSDLISPAASLFSLRQPKDKAIIVFLKQQYFSVSFFSLSSWKTTQCFLFMLHDQSD